MKNRILSLLIVFSFLISLTSSFTNLASTNLVLSKESITNKKNSSISLIIQVDDEKNTSFLLKELEELSIPSFTLIANEFVDDFIFATINYSSKKILKSTYEALIALSNTQVLEPILDSIKSIPCVKLVELDAPIDVAAISDDYYSDSQWVLDNPGSYKSIRGSSSGTVYTTPNIDIDIPEAWETFKETIKNPKPVVVAIIDTGVDYKHQDLKDHMWINPNEIPGDGIDNDKNGYIDDVYGWDFYNNDSTVCHYEYNSRLKLDLSAANDCDDHGTHVAGIIAATSNNQVGIAGVASNIDTKIMSLKIHGGAEKKGNISDAIKAIKYAKRQGATFCNMSWGTYSYSEALYNAMNESGLLFVTAAGNDGINTDKKPLYPACFDLDNIISVGYVDANGILSPDSNYGIESVDVVVPSVDVYSTIVGSYDSLTGSSMAAAHMSGLVALIYSTGNSYFPSGIKDYVLSNIKPISDLEKYIKSPGIPSGELIVSNIKQVKKDTTPPTINFTRTFVGPRILLKLEPFDTESGINQVRYFVGKKTLADFKNGTAGTYIGSNELSLIKSGFYTFYVSDNAGNEIVYPHYVFDDDTAPIISASNKVSFDYKTITVNLSIIDSASGVKQAKYSIGENLVEYFLKANQGTVLEVKNDTASFKVTEPGKYTIYSIDNRGNKRIYTYNARIIKSKDLTLEKSKKTLKVGKTFKIKSNLTPANSTDALKYKSSNNKIAKVSKYGKITALKPGKATITVTTASGIKKTIKITVKKN